MRRTLSLAVTTGILAALGGLAQAAAPEPATGPSAAPATGPVTTPGRAQIGAVEQVDETLGYLDADRSVTLHYPGASYVKVHLSRLLLLPGDYLTVSDPSGTEVHRYEAEPLLGLTDALAGGRWATSVTGDTAEVQLHHRNGDQGGLRGTLARLGVTIDRVARGLAPEQIPPVPQPEPEGRQESLCGGNDARDAVCYEETHPTIYRRTKAVVRLLIDGVEMCTGFRIGASNRLLTNNHCIASSRDARRTEVWFNYQCAECGGRAVFRPTKVRGERVLATDRTLDFTLFTVDNFSSVEKFGYLKPDPRETRVGERIYIPQHPAGTPTRVALASDRDRGRACRVADPAAHGYDWHTDVSYYCDTRGGSSGSPVLSTDTHRVVGLHHFGGCPNSGVRMDLIHERIADLL